MSSIVKRIIVTGREGQLVQSLQERGRNYSRFEIVSLGRPELDLADPRSIEVALRRAQPDVIVSAAAYTAVDQAETDEETATIVNGLAPGEIARIAAKLGVPMIHLSTDYVFDGGKDQPYDENDPVAPVGAYGRSKLKGELAVAIATDNYAILRTAWVFSPFGKNFLKTMLRLAESGDSCNVVGDQVGNPTSALDIADGVIAVALNLLDSDSADLRGVFHMTGSGEASWADFAEEIFAYSARFGLPSAVVRRISSSEYPTPSKRPANSRLNCGKLAAIHGVRLPHWKLSTATVIERIATAEFGRNT